MTVTEIVNTEPMTVADVIAMLQKLPQDFYVAAFDPTLDAHQSVSGCTVVPDERCVEIQTADL